MKRISYAITDNNVTVNFDGQTHIIGRKDALADRLIQALRDGREKEIPDLVSAAKRVESFSKGNFVVKDGVILINGQEAPPVLGNKIVKFANEGLPYQPLVKFAENLQKNPSFRAVSELFQFLEKNDHPITENGCFIAYKRVRSDFKDIHSGTFDNSVGQVVSMPRNQVNEDSAQTCSNGLHVANWDYAHNHFGNVQVDIMLEVEVNPANVVSIPVDYNQSKMRVCEYKVLGVVDTEHSSDVSLRVVDQEKFDGDLASDEAEVNHCIECDWPIADGETFCDLCTDSDSSEEEEDECCDCCDCDCDKDQYPWEDELG